MNTLHAAVVTFNLAELEPEYGDIQRITSRLELERLEIRRLGIGRSTLYRKLREYELDPDAKKVG